MHGRFLISKGIESYTIYDSTVLSMVTKILEQVFQKTPNGTNLILHSDKDWRHQYTQYCKMLKDKKIMKSMGHKGNCLDNDVGGSCFL